MGIELLDGVREKLIRAREHLDTFQLDIASYAASNPYRIVREFEDHIPEKSGRAGLTWRAQVDAPPALTFAVIVGDCLHNLRSALDHLAWALVLENGGEPGDTDPKTQFPIFLNPPKSKTGQPKQVTIRAKDGGPSLAATTILEMLQPYNGGHEANLHPLWLLRCLSNIDKHRTLTVTALDLGRIVMRFPNGRTTYAVRRDVEYGTMVMWILEEAEDFDREIEGEAHFTPSVEFRDARGIGMQPFLPASDLLAKLLEFTRDSVIQRFARSCFGGELSFP